MKKRTIRIWIVLGIALIAIGFIKSINSGKPLSAKGGRDSGEIDRLLKEMGILRPVFLSASDDVDLIDLHGKKIRLSDFKGNVVFLNFWATWCPPCVKEMPAMEKLHRHLKENHFVMAAVGLKESADRVKKFLNGKKLSFTALLDPKGDLGKQFAIASIPTTLILDKKGEIIGRALGPRDWASRKSVRLFKRLADMP